MIERQTYPTNEQPRPPTIVVPPASARGGQREDVPYHWPRGPELPATPAERRLDRLITIIVPLMCLAALALLWYMIAKSTRGI